MVSASERNTNETPVMKTDLITYVKAENARIQIAYVCVKFTFQVVWCIVMFIHCFDRTYDFGRWIVR